MITDEWATKFARIIADHILPERGYIGLCRDVSYLTGEVKGEPCIGPKTNYYRIPYVRDDDFYSVKKGKVYILCNSRDLCFTSVGKKPWKNIEYMFISDTADRPVAKCYQRIWNCPVTMFNGDTALFVEGDLEITLDF